MQNCTNIISLKCIVTVNVLIVESCLGVLGLRLAPRASFLFYLCILLCCCGGSPEDAAGFSPRNVECIFFTFL